MFTRAFCKQRPHFVPTQPTRNPPPNLSCPPPPPQPRTMHDAGRRGSHSCSNRLCFLTTGSSVCVSRENDTRQLDRATLVDLVSSCGASVATGRVAGKQTKRRTVPRTHTHGHRRRFNAALTTYSLSVFLSWIGSE